MILFKNKVDLKIIILHPLGESKKKNLRFVSKIKEQRSFKTIVLSVEEILPR